MVFGASTKCEGKEMTSINRLLNCILLALVLQPLQGCSREYSAESIEAWVVDAETSQPLEGVIVVAHWQLYGGMHPDQLGELMILETLTDKAGRFHFPAWGPKSVPAGLASNARLRHLDPEMLLFKSGYKYQRIANELTSAVLNDAGPSLRRSQWNGKTIKMEKFGGTQKEYADHLSFLKTSLGFAYNGQDCEWKLIPRMLLAQHNEMLRLEEKKIYNTLQSVENVSGQKKCGSAQEFFRGYLP